MLTRTKAITKTKGIGVVSHTDQRTPCLEEFTSSTCAPCASFNTNFVPWCVTNADDIALIKYQMSWPGNGDPYYTEEGGVRRGYYGVSWVPWLVADGVFAETDMGAVNNFFTSSMATPALTSVIGTHSISGTTIDVTATVLPYANFSNSRVYVIVFENKTVNNTGTNGETEFEHVMMKMLPDANGTSVDFIDREPVTITESFDMASTNVEEFDDLGVIIIVQDNSTATIYQSGYSVENASYATEARLSDVTADGVSIPNFDSEVHEYNIELPEGTTTVPVLVGTAMDENETIIVVPATELPGTSVIDVFAEDLSTHIRYTFNYTVAVGVHEVANSNIKLYPNPNNGQFYISGLTGDAQVSIFDISGKKVAGFNNNISKINVDNLLNGVYFIQIKSNEGIVSKRFTINK